MKPPYQLGNKSMSLTSADSISINMKQLLVGAAEQISHLAAIVVHVTGTIVSAPGATTVSGEDLYRLLTNCIFVAVPGAPNPISVRSIEGLRRFLALRNWGVPYDATPADIPPNGGGAPVSTPFSFNFTIPFRSPSEVEPRNRMFPVGLIRDGGSLTIGTLNAQTAIDAAHSLSAFDLSIEAHLEFADEPWQGIWSVVTDYGTQSQPLPIGEGSRLTMITFQGLGVGGGVSLAGGTVGADGGAYSQVLPRVSVEQMARAWRARMPVQPGVTTVVDSLRVSPLVWPAYQEPLSRAFIDARTQQLSASLTGISLASPLLMVEFVYPEPNEAFAALKSAIPSYFSKPWGKVKATANGRAVQTDYAPLVPSKYVMLDGKDMKANTHTRPTQRAAI